MGLWSLFGARQAPSATRKPSGERTAMLGLETLEGRRLMAVIDNGLATTTAGYFSLDVQNGGESHSGFISAQGLTGFQANASAVFDFINYIDIGSDGDAEELGAAGFSTITQLATLIAPGVVRSAGFFAGPNGRIDWNVTTSIAPGSPVIYTSIAFSSTANFGNIRFINYLDEDILGISDDVLVPVGTPGQSNFVLFTLDNPERVGFGQGGIYNRNDSRLQGATWIGWAADEYAELKTIIQGAGTTYTQAGNIDLVSLPLINDPTLGNMYGEDDITSALAWDLDANGRSAIITVILQLTPEANQVELGTIAGRKFNDISGNGNDNGGTDPGLPGWTIYLDLDNDNVLDVGEPTTITDAAGNYEFALLPRGFYTIREVQQAGWFATAPLGGAYTVDLTSVLEVARRDFGNLRLVGPGETGLGLDPCGELALFAQGTEGSDKILLLGLDSGEYRLIVNQRFIGDFLPRSRIYIYGYGGNDTIRLDHRVYISAFIDAGAGKDIVVGGQGNDVIFGGSGNDRISGGRAGRDILIGGFGKDIIRGQDFKSPSPQTDTDYIIGDATIYDAAPDIDALCDLFEVWDDPNLSRVDRFYRLQNGIGVPPLGKDQIIFDRKRDKIFGGPGVDIFFYRRRYDTILDLRRQDDEVRT